MSKIVTDDDVKAVKSAEAIITEAMGRCGIPRDSIGVTALLRVAIADMIAGGVSARVMMEGFGILVGAMTGATIVVYSKAHGGENGD